MHARQTATETNIDALKEIDLRKNPQITSEFVAQKVFKKFIRSSSH